MLPVNKKAPVRIHERFYTHTNIHYMKQIIFSSLLAALLVTACRTPAVIQQPPADLPATYSSNSADTNSMGSIAWKSFFNDTALQGLIQQTLQHNYEWRIALENIERSARVLEQSKAGNLPELGFAVNAQTTRLSENSLNGLSTRLFLGRKHLEDYSAAFSASWEADIWGKIRAQKQQALAQYMATTEATRALQTRLVADVATAYYNLLTLDEQLRIARRNVVLSDSTLYLMQLQFNAGDATGLAIRQTQAQRDVAALLVPQLQQAITMQENSLKILTGDFPGKVNRSADTSTPVTLQELKAGIPALLLRSRPDIRQREYELRAATAGVQVAQSALYPALRINAGGGVNTFTASNWFSIPSSLFGVVAGSVAQPILQRKQLRTGVALAKIDREQAVLQFRQSVLLAVGEVSDALVGIEKLGEQRTIAHNRRNTLQSAVAQSGMLFKSGMATYLEVVIAQANALQSELELSNIKRQQQNTVIQLYRALGGGWQ
jgi:multidrug efflux system outer membrane protein